MTMTKTEDCLNETDLVASICRESFYEFLQEFWDIIIPEDFSGNWHIKLLCDELQRMAERVFAGEPTAYDLIVNISPGTTKSTITSVMYPMWVWTRMPTARFICGSHTHDLVLDLSRKSRYIAENNERVNGRPSYQACYPEIVLQEDQNTKGHFANTLGGMRKSVTVGGKSPTGFHAHFLIVDDPLDPQKALSAAELKNANDWMNETLPSRKVDARLTPTILIMQRLHQNDPSGNRLARKEGHVKHFCIPADSRDYEVKPTRLKKFYKDDLMDPVRLPRSVLVEQRARLGEYGYSGQYGQSPVPLKGGMFKVDRFTLAPPPPKAFIKKTVRYWDKAATQDGGAWTVGVLMCLDSKGRFWILNVVRGQWATDERERIMRQTAELDGKGVQIGVEEEGGSTGKDATLNTTRNLVGFKVIAERPTGDKTLRADPFSTQVNGGNVSIAPGPWNAAYLEEFRYFPASTYKDQVDATSGGFRMLYTMKKKIGAL